MLVVVADSDDGLHTKRARRRPTDMATLLAGAGILCVPQCDKRDYKSVIRSVSEPGSVNIV